jgi:hypothetical protein
MGKLAFLLVVVVILYFVFKGNDPKPVAPLPSASSDTYTPETTPSHSSTSSWGSGHQAGYDWAAEKGINDDDACEQAGDHSNSPSFAEGCKAYVEEQR